MKILADASLPNLLSAFPKPFEVTMYHHNDDVHNLLLGQDILLCRSTLKVNKTLLTNQSLRFVTTASSGVDHIDLSALRAENIQLLDAKGSNATAVADYVLSSVAYLQKFKNFRGQKAGIIGLGAVGTQVAKRLRNINFQICCYDPPKSIKDERFKSCSLTELLECDLICIHANLHEDKPYPSRHLIAESELSFLKKNAVIINASRGDIVSENALINVDKPLFYCTDVYANEPKISNEIINFSSLCTPHIAGHSIEAKAAAVFMVSQKLHYYYQLPFPDYPRVEIKDTSFNHYDSWQEQVLSLYNPMHETQDLKQATDKKAAFLQLRKAHQHRHDFCASDWHILKERRLRAAALI
jgi:erythronate-4-phosphate dehydrogenase